MLTKEALTPLVNTSLTPAQRADVEELICSTPELCDKYGDLFEWTRNAVLDMLDPNTIEYLCTVEGLNQMRNNLLEQGDSYLEQLAVEQIITSHVQVARSGFRLESMEPTDELLNQTKHWVKTHNLAQARLMRAMHGLTRLRKAKTDLELKLRKNRPLNYDKSDYLTVSEEIIRLRQDSLQDEAQAAYEQRMIRQHAAREERQNEAEIEREAKKLSLDISWEKFLAKNELLAMSTGKPKQDALQVKPSPKPMQSDISQTTESIGKEIGTVARNS